MVISVALVFVGIQTPVAHAAQRQISIEKLGLLGRVQFAAKSIKKDSQLKPPITEATTGPV